MPELPGTRYQVPCTSIESIRVHPIFACAFFVFMQNCYYVVVVHGVLVYADKLRPVQYTGVVYHMTSIYKVRSC